MSCRSTILIDNFLSTSDFNSISSRVVSSEQYYDTKHYDMRDDLWSDVTNLVFNRLREINLYQLLSLLIDKGYYKKDKIIKNLIFEFMEVFLLRKITSNYNLISNNFLRKINNIKKFNLDDESLFIDFKHKVLNG